MATGRNEQVTSRAVSNWARMRVLWRRERLQAPAPTSMGPCRSKAERSDRGHVSVTPGITMLFTRASITRCTSGISGMENGREGQQTMGSGVRGQGGLDSDGPSGRR